MTAGRPRKPTSTLKLHGDYREDRHGNRTEDQASLGTPIQPKMASAAARAEWKRLTRHIPQETLAEMDSMMLRMACEQAASFVAAVETGDDAGQRKAIESYTRVLSKLGLTPVDRSKLNWGAGKQSSLTEWAKTANGS